MSDKLVKAWLDKATEDLSDGLPSKPEAEEAIKIADAILKFVNLRLTLTPP